MIGFYIMVLIPEGILKDEIDGFNPIIIATKADKISRGAIQKHVSIIRKTLKCVEGTPIIPFSSLKKTGIDQVWEYIEEMLEYYEAEKNGTSVVLEGEGEEE